MPTSLFSPKKLEKYKKKLSRQKTNRDKPYKNSKKSFDPHELSNSLFEGSFKFERFHIKKQKKLTFQCQTLQDDVVMHALNKAIIGVYKVRQSDRNLMVKQVIDLINENHEKYVYRLDIKSFYESISLFKSIKKITDDGLLSSEYEHALWSMYNEITPLLARIQKVKGLPRGLSISSTLSEIFMRNFDDSIRKLDSVYYYARYVDDIIIISTERICINEQISTLLPTDLKLNYQKLSWFEVHESNCKKKCKCNKEQHQLDFLGYSFNFPKFNCKKSEPIKISLSQNKLTRFEERIHKSFAYFKAKGKPSLLVKRIAFLTLNYPVDQNKADKYELYSGIYFNYMRINNFEHLRKLDELLYYHIYNCPNFGRFSISRNLAITLRQYSFVKGFVNREIRHFMPTEIKTIKRIWNA